MHVRSVPGIKGSIPDIAANSDDLYLGDLRHYFRIVFHDANNNNNPYHNFRHTCHMLWLCYQACAYYEGRLTEEEMRQILIAALFHDFNHTGKLVSDDENIKRAVLGLKLNALPEDRPYLGAIVHLIQSTRFPYNISSESLELPALILRDADMMQALNVAWIQQVVFGLAAEWGKKPLDVLKMQPAFLGKLSFHTDWAKEMFPQAEIDAKIDEAKRLLHILDLENGS